MSGDTDFDAEAAMKEAMGFSSFATRRPKDDTSAAQQPDSHGQPQEHSEGSVTSSARYSSTVYSGTDNRSRGAFSVHESASESPNFVYTSPTGVGFTKAELNAWARGKKNENGDLVFFKPGFISDDPWKRLRPETGNSG